MERGLMEATLARAKAERDLAQIKYERLLARFGLADPITCGVDVQKTGIQIGATNSALADLLLACTDGDGDVDIHGVKVLQFRAIIDILVGRLGPEGAAKVIGEVVKITL